MSWLRVAYLYNKYLRKSVDKNAIFKPLEIRLLVSPKTRRL